MEMRSPLSGTDVRRGRLLSETVARARLDIEDGLCDLALAVAGGLPGRLPAETAEMTGQSLEWDTL